jgi:ribose transport system ATP-binding protein
MGRELRTEGIRKEFPGTVALDGVSVAFGGGRVHALLGKNGAGKSTLVKVLAGIERPTAGRVLLDGTPLDLRSPRDAFARGIATVHQELSLIPGLTVGENILLGRLPRRAGGWVLDWPATFARAEEVLRGMDVEIDPRLRVSDLSVGRQQVVEIAKAMSFDPAVLMLDEPTSALARHETEGLFRLVRRLASRGVIVIYITHRLQELRQIADTVTVLRDGRLVGTAEMKDATPEWIVRSMFGEVVRKTRPGDLKAGEEPVLEVRGLGRRGAFHDVSFTLRRGEVLGIAGMLGSGRSELLRAIFGAEPFDEGEILLEGRPVPRPDPVLMRRLGVAFTPEDRKGEGLVQGLCARANLCMASLDRIAPGGFITRGRERPVVERLTRDLRIAMADPERAVSVLSGGNQQKVAVGKWLNAGPKVVLLDEPTRGIDVQAKQQIFQIAWDLSRRGIATVLVSSELEELAEACHRILIMKKGTLAGELRPEEVSPDGLYVRCMED